MMTNRTAKNVVIETSYRGPGSHTVFYFELRTFPGIKKFPCQNKKNEKNAASLVINGTIPDPMQSVSAGRVWYRVFDEVCETVRVRM